MPALQIPELVLRPFTVSLDPYRVRRFEAAIGLEPDASGPHAAPGEAARPVPPTFLFGLDLEFGEVLRHLAEHGVEAASCLHVEQEFEYFTPAFAGEVLTFSPQFVEPAVPARGALRFLARRTLVTRAGGEQVALLRQVIAVRAAGGDS